MTFRTADYYIEKLNLAAHVEGGAFKETYRAPVIIPKNALPQGFNGNRNASTAIYFLLKHGQFSAFHKIAADELWHFYDGNTLCIYEITTEGKLIKHLLGRDFDKGESLQIVISAGSWFASRCEVVGSFSLVGCTVAPGFDFDDFVLAEKQRLSALFPQYSKLIEELTY